MFKSYRINQIIKLPEILTFFNFFLKTIRDQSSPESTCRVEPHLRTTVNYCHTHACLFLYFKSIFKINNFFILN